MEFDDKPKGYWGNVVYMALALVVIVAACFLAVGVVTLAAWLFITVNAWLIAIGAFWSNVVVVVFIALVIIFGGAAMITRAERRPSEPKDMEYTRAG